MITTDDETGINFEIHSGATGTSVVAISNSIASGNSIGVAVSLAGTTQLKISIDNLNAAGNRTDGVNVEGPALVVLGRSTITGNQTGVFFSTSPNNLVSYGNNQVNLNINDFIPSAPPGNPTR